MRWTGIALWVVVLVLVTAPALAEDEPLPPPPPGNPIQLKTEAYLEELDLEDEEIRFEPFNAGCSIVLKVQERYFKRKQERWRSVAVMKTRSGFTYLQAEVGYYRLGKYLDFDIFAVTVYRELGADAIEKIILALEDRSYGSECKEKSREKLIEDLYGLMESDEPKLKVILKEWLPLFKNFPSDGFRKLPREFDFHEHLTTAGEQPPDDVIEFPARRRSKRSTRYAALANVRDMVMDVSNLMVLDAVASQYDRWGGHNIHFRLVDDSEFVEGEDEVHRGGMARILALDNGSAMRSKTTRAFDWLKEHVHRYDPSFVERLRHLQRWIKEEPRKARKWLGLPRFEFRNLRKNLRTVLKHIDKETHNHPERWFTPQP